MHSIGPDELCVLRTIGALLYDCLAVLGELVFLDIVAYYADLFIHSADYNALPIMPLILMHNLKLSRLE